MITSRHGILSLSWLWLPGLCRLDNIHADLSDHIHANLADSCRLDSLCDVAGMAMVAMQWLAWRWMNFFTISSDWLGVLIKLVRHTWFYY